MMGRSTASCFKIITCGSDPGEAEDIEASEDSSDKRGWSFRKKSTKNRLLSNIAISEMPSSVNKESPETAAVNFQTQPPSTNFAEKTSRMSVTDETPKLSAILNLKEADSIIDRENDTMHDIYPDESVVVVIQTAIRGFLGQREILKLKKVVKLQAAVRGLLVRRQAVGTLRCVQAIVKMQALVRARLARLSSEGPLIEGKENRSHAKDDSNSMLLDNGNSVAKPNLMYTSIEKLLNNKFAYQLMESAPRTKRINIKCDPSKSDSAWIWLERWMSVSSMGAGQPEKPESREQDKVEYSACEMETGFPSEGCESTDLKAKIRETTVPSNGEQKLITKDYNFDFQACQQTSSSKSDNPNPPQHENSGTSKSNESSLDLLPNHTEQSDSISQRELKSVTSKPEMGREQSARIGKKFAPEQVEIEGKKFMFGTSKASNPAFIAVQSKFEELSSTANSARSTSSYNQDIGDESNSEAISSGMDNAIRKREICLADNSELHILRDRVGGSDCGTELSITSTLDSPDRSEIGLIDVEQEAQLYEEGTSNTNSTKNQDFEANGESRETTTTGSDLCYSISVHPEKHDTVDVEPVISVPPVDLFPEKKMSEISNVDIGLDLETGLQTSKSSPEASPRSHMTVPELQATPFSPVSGKAERTTRGGRGGSNQKCKSLSAGRRSPSNPNNDSGVRSSLEQLPKEDKAGKRRNSFGTGRPDYVDQDPRDSNSSNSLPNYMQATESARAKALANSSPRSSPDTQDKDVYIKKRHSLPGENGRQGSPPIRRSSSRTLQVAKENGHRHERKWQR